jgi:hypothetical protein
MDGKTRQPNEFAHKPLGMKELTAFLYWFTCGALIGLGLASIFFIGLLLIVLGVVFLLYEAQKVGVKDLWAVVVGFGVAPAGLMLSRYLTSNLCPDGTSGISMTVGPSESFSCSGFPDGYLYYVTAFGVVALIGLGWGLYRRLAVTRVHA